MARPRRKRCASCNQLKGDTVQVEGKPICQDCLPGVAEAVADEEPKLTFTPINQLKAEAEAEGLPPLRTAAEIEVERLRVAEKYGVATGDVHLPAPTVQEHYPVPSLATKEDRIARARRVPSVEAPGWPLAKGRLSASAIASFLTCPERFRQSYIKGRWGPSRAKQVSGKAVHEALDVAMRYQMAHGVSLPVDVAKDVAADAYTAVVEDEREIEWGDDDRGEWKDRSVQVAATWVEHVAPLLRPVATEQSFAYMVPGCPVPVVGYIDLITETAMADYKIGRAYRRVQNDWRVQGHIYLRATTLPMAWHSLSWPLKDGSVSYHTPIDEGAGLTMPNTAANYEIGGRLVVNTAEAIMMHAERFGPDETWPGALGHQYACTFCDFHPDRAGGCQWWQTTASDAGWD